MFLFLRAIYILFFCQVSADTLCPISYRDSLLHDLEWLFKNKKMSPLSDNLPSTTHSTPVAMCTTQLMQLFHVTNDVRWG
jgi:hypothetical protein